MAFDDENYLDGGLYPPGDPDRTTVYIKETGFGPDGKTACGTLVFVTGNASIDLFQLSYSDLARLGKWIQEVAIERRGYYRDYPEEIVPKHLEKETK